MNLIPLVIASKNVHKIREYKEMLKPLKKFDILSLLDFPDYIPPEEDRDTFKGNAEKKAIHAAKELNKLVLSDDSGLVVPSINGEPGVYSARYSGENGTDIDNRKKLLSKMEHLNDEDRNGYFECCIVLATPNGIKKSSSAICEGMIIKKERGGSGFGYDPIFIKNEYNKTFAELDSTVKNKISHRRKAFDKILPTLETIV